MKNLANLKGAKMLTKNDQKLISGGKKQYFNPCPEPMFYDEGLGKCCWAHDFCV